MIGSDSHSESTLRRVVALLGDRAIDFLFIDGDHSRDGVWQDFNTYSRLVPPGGLIAFHDISQNPAGLDKGRGALLAEFSAEHETQERVVSGDAGFGIGVYRVPESLRPMRP